jgi:hypothetical protein
MQAWLIDAALHERYAVPMGLDPVRRKRSVAKLAQHIWEWARLKFWWGRQSTKSSLATHYPACPIHRALWPHFFCEEEVTRLQPDAPRLVAPAFCVLPAGARESTIPPRLVRRATIRKATSGRGG